MRDSSSRTRAAYIAEALLEYLVSLLVSGAFLAAILKNIGVSDALTGVVSSMISVTCVAQLFSGRLLAAGRAFKAKVVAVGQINQVLFASLYALPFLPLGQSVKTALFVFLILTAYLLYHYASPAKYQWLMGFVGENERGRYTAKKEIVSLIGGMLFSLLMAALIDRFTAEGRGQTGFLLSGGILLAVSGLHFLSIQLCDAPARDLSQARAEPLRALGGLVRERFFRRLIAMDVLWAAAFSLSIPFYGTYLIGELGFSLTFVSLTTILYSVARALISPALGRFADTRGWGRLLRLCFAIAMVAFGVNAFTRPGAARYLYLVYYTLYAISMAGINSGIYNITYDYTGQFDFASIMGVRNAVSGVFGFLASIAGGLIVGVIQKNGNQFLGHAVYAQQLTSALSFLLIAVLLAVVERGILRPKAR